MLLAIQRAVNFLLGKESVSPTAPDCKSVFIRSLSQQGWDSSSSRLRMYSLINLKLSWRFADLGNFSLSVSRNVSRSSCGSLFESKSSALMILIASTIVSFFSSIALYRFL